MMDTVKFALVIALPSIATFGYLIIASVSAITVGAIFFTVHYFKSTDTEKEEESDKLSDHGKDCDKKNNYGSILVEKDVLASPDKTAVVLTNYEKKQTIF